MLETKLNLLIGQTFTYTTKNGTVTLRFYGDSNGYYATDVAIGMTSKSTGRKIMVC